MANLGTRTAWRTFCCVTILATAGMSRAAEISCADNFDASNTAWTTSPLYFSDPTMRGEAKAEVAQGARTVTHIWQEDRNHALDVWATHLNTSCSHIPATGWFTTVTAVVSSAPTGTMYYRPLIVQDGKTFVPTTSTASGAGGMGAMTTYSKTTNVEDFKLLHANGTMDLSSHPDLSCSAKPLNFGYYTYNYVSPKSFPRSAEIRTGAWEMKFETALPPALSGVTFSFPYNGVLQTKVPADPALSGAVSGTVLSSTTLPAGQTGEAVSINAGGRIDFAADPAINFGTGDFSIDAWIKIPHYPKTVTLIDNRVPVGKSTNGSTGSRGVTLFTYEGRIGMSMADGPTHNFISLKRISDNKWHHVAVTVDRDVSTGGIIYVDGVQTDMSVGVKTFNPTLHPNSLGTLQALAIGGTNLTGGSNQQSFDIDDLEFFNRTLNPGEVLSLANSSRCKP